MDKKYFLPFITVTLCFIFQASISQVARTTCTPNGYEQTFGYGPGIKSQIATYWFYNERGLLITDSLLLLDSHTTTAPHTTVHYSYNNDSVIGIGNDGRRVVILLNQNGLPLFTSDPENRTLNAAYDNSGFLVRVNEIRDSMTVFIDDVIHRNGNIISYHEPQTNVTFVLKYYKNKFGNSIYTSQRPFALRSTRIFVTMIDVQAFSKNLLKSVTWKVSKKKNKLASFNYTFDKRNRPVSMRRITYNSVLGSDTSDYVFFNPCK